MYGKLSRQSRTAGATINPTRRIPTGHASHQRPSHSPSNTSPNAASSGRQNANISTRSGGYQPVAVPNASPAALTTAHEIRNRRGEPRARDRPRIASAGGLNGGDPRQVSRERSREE